MVNIAILEDDAGDEASLEQSLQRYAQEQQELFSIRSFSDPAVFLQNSPSAFDLIFLDIDLPTMTGMELARQIRRQDSLVTLIFVTNLEKYAVSGYSVGAFDFVVKPINYYRFASMLRRALRSIAARQPREVVIQTSGGHHPAQRDPAVLCGDPGPSADLPHRGGESHRLGQDVRRGGPAGSLRLCPVQHLPPGESAVCGFGGGQRRAGGGHPAAHQPAAAQGLLQLRHQLFQPEVRHPT